MNEIQNDALLNPDAIQSSVVSTDTVTTSVPVTTRKSAGQGQSFRVGNKIVRVDAASISTPQSHLHAQADARAAAEAARSRASYIQEIEHEDPTAEPTDTSKASGSTGAHQTTGQVANSWQDLIGVIDTHLPEEMGIGDVLANNEALQRAATELADAESLQRKQRATRKTPRAIRVKATETPKPKQHARSSTDVQAETVPAPRIKGALDIQPAWEVDYFRWPRLSRRLLQTHQQLFDQIGGKLLNELQPTRTRIGVCSTFPREGKTTIATCLARWPALTGRRTLLIDADVERPTMPLMCCLDCTFGWQSILDANIPISETMIRSIESGLVFMPSRSGSVPDIQEKTVDRLSQVTFQMKYEFDVVVLDMGTIDNVCAHGSPEMDVVDAMLVTRDPSQTSVGQMMDTRRVLENLGIRRTYVAQNFARRDVA